MLLTPLRVVLRLTNEREKYPRTRQILKYKCAFYEHAGDNVLDLTFACRVADLYIDLRLESHYY